MFRWTTKPAVPAQGKHEPPLSIGTDFYEGSYRDQYTLMKLVQASAVGSCAVGMRNLASGRLAVAAKGYQRRERAREAYVDAIEDLQVLKCVLSKESPRGTV